MKNCIHETLKSAATDSSLLAIGEFRIKVNNQISDAILPFQVQATTPFTAKIIGDGHFYKGSISQQTDVTTVISNTTDTSGYRLSTGVYEVSITPKYGLIKINVSADKAKQKDIAMNIDDLHFNSAITLVVSGDNGNTVGVHQSISGDLSSLPDGSLININNSDVTGTMKDMAKFNYNDFRQSGETAAVPSKNIIGSIEDFVENARSENYNKKIRLAVNFYNNKPVTFHGTVYNNTLVHVTLDPSGNAAVANGSDVQIATYTKSTGVWSYD